MLFVDNHIIMTKKVVLILLGLLVTTSFPSNAQISLTFDALPYQNFSDPISGLEPSEVYSNATKIDISYPFVLRPEQTVLQVGLSWERRAFEYRRFPEEDPNINSIHDAQLTLMITHTLSEKWSLLGFVIPGVASDLKGDLTGEDFNFQAVFAAIRKVGPRFSYGIGLAYSSQFGEPIPLPVLMFDMNNGKKLSWLTILPISSEFWYAHSMRVHLGILLEVQGNQFQGDPNRYDVDDPQLIHSIVTMGPSARFAFLNGLFLQVDSGVVALHRFEFYDGDTEAASFNLKPSAYLRMTLSFGG